MPRKTRRPDLHTLTGAYALDALSEPERADFERHLAECDACAEEVVELRTAATRLAVAAQPPPGLRERLLAEVHHTRQLPPPPAAAPRPTRAAVKDRRPWPLIAVAASVAAALLSGAHAVNLDRDLDLANQERQVARGHLAGVTRVLGAADVTFSSGQGATVAASRGLGEVVLLARNLPVLPADRVYQAWLIGPTGPRSLGVLTDPGPLRAEHAAGATQLGITVEPLGGSPQPTTSAVALLSLRG
ncbi:Anti-sigma-K factor RskA [Actinokineospora alba]|uniref:Regulator of SigK n=1 Tax=Actinokineospora alba TaxID=504798 RepID=A0A1H0W1I2_9PSEU|nr:anti-sigma factor [Actinokineospora alba]TDP67771.1 anti-sigma-K factor RskA [Actinokineospora alba]SDI71567.1 Anti-sigma-K factor RskA [Actinokineospora alba]SDP84597.1 Anti-sigma-K factor RskA [Actinokineospora alba]